MSNPEQDNRGIFNVPLKKYLFDEEWNRAQAEAFTKTAGEKLHELGQEASRKIDETVLNAIRGDQ